MKDEVLSMSKIMKKEIIQNESIDKLNVTVLYCNVSPKHRAPSSPMELKWRSSSINVWTK